MTVDNHSRNMAMFDAEAVALARSITFEQLFLLLSGSLNVKAIKKKTDHDAALRLMVLGLQDHCPTLSSNVHDYVAHGQCMPTLFKTMALENIKTFETLAPEHVGYQRQIPWLRAYTLVASKVNVDELGLRFTEEWIQYSPRARTDKRKADAVIKKAPKKTARVSSRPSPYAAVKPAPPRKAKKATPPKLKVGRPPKIIPKQHWQKTLLESVPGLGPLASSALIARFGSASAVFMASLEELYSVEGVGYRLAENISEAMGLALTRARNNGLDLARLRAIPGIGLGTAKALLAQYGSAQAVFDAMPEFLELVRAVAINYIPRKAVVAKEVSEEDRQLTKLYAIPGIGPTNAKELLDHFGSVPAIFSATVTELTAVPHVGLKTAINIVYAVKGTYP